MSETLQPTAVPSMDEDAKHDFLRRKAKKKYKAQVRKFRREAENDNGELNLTAMMDMMTILLVFLIKSFGASEISVASGDDLMPPMSSSTAFPMPAITVTVTKKEIAVGPKGVLKLKSPKELSPDDLGPVGITKLSAGLEAEVKKISEQIKYNPKMRDAIAQNPEKDQSKVLIIVADRELPYSILYNVLGTAGLAGLKYFKFLTINPNG
jgi:biopolymer transport protein ExbD